MEVKTNTVIIGLEEFEEYTRIANEHDLLIKAIENARKREVDSCAKRVVDNEHPYITNYFDLSTLSIFGFYKTITEEEVVKRASEMKREKACAK